MVLANELLAWVRQRIQEPLTNLGAQDVRVANITYTKQGDFTYYERHVNPTNYQPEDFDARWSESGKALELYKGDDKWFSWYPQGRQNSRNQNQLHFHGENHLTPDADAPNRFDFMLGEYGTIEFNVMLNALLPLVDDN